MQIAERRISLKYRRHAVQNTGERISMLRGDEILTWQEGERERERESIADRCPPTQLYLFQSP